MESPTRGPATVSLAMARRLLAAEAPAGGGAEACAAAAGAVYDKLEAQLAPLLGVPGFQALLGRSAKLRQGEFTGLGEIAGGEGATKLRERLRVLDPVAAASMAEALFGTFLGLLVTFIGERLTGQALRRAWPTIEQSASMETKR